jgi:hypothetical protein
MRDNAQLKRQLDDILAGLRQRLTEALQRKAKAEREAQNSAREIDFLTKGIDALQPIQGYFGLALESKKPERGYNRKAVVAIMSRANGSMTVSQIADIAFSESLIKSSKGRDGVYGTVATTLSRGKSVFVNLNGEWGLRGMHRDLKPSSVVTGAKEDDPRKRRRLTVLAGAPQPSLVPPEIARLKVSDG